MDEINLATDYKLFVDTNALMHEKAGEFFYRLAPVLIEFKKQIIIPDKVVKEINRLQKSAKTDTKSAAQSGAVILRHYTDYKLIDIRGEKNDPFADNVFFYVISKFITQYDLALITQDKGLAMDILSQKRLRAIQSSKKLLVLKLNRWGTLSEWKDEHSVMKLPSTAASEEVQKFRILPNPRPQKDLCLGIHEIPNEGDYIYADEFGRIRLNRIIGEGGEGKIFFTDSGLACKIYFKERLTENRFEKLTLMAERKIDIAGVCWPSAPAKNSRKEFVGYLMPAAKGSPMQKCMFVKPLLEKNFSHWSRKNLVQLSISWLEKVVALHSLNILLGDVNPLNFLIKSDKELFFVDTDSYQIEDFPCPVGMANFTAPEIQGKDFSAFMRMPEHEYFAIATLLFMILLPGKPPYSHQGGGDPVKNIQKGEFSYPLGEKSNRKTPDGPWRFIWSHLPYKTKEAFYNCFVNQKRITPYEWLVLMKNYKYDIEQGHLDPDGESDKIFPTRFKGVSSYAKEKYDAEDGGLESFMCDICGKTFQLNSVQADKIRNLQKKLCRDCYQIQKMENTTGDTIICSECGQHFLFSVSEKKYFDQKGLDTPKRCKQCRDSRKVSKSATAVPYSHKVQAENRSDKSLWDILKSIFE